MDWCKANSETVKAIYNECFVSAPTTISQLQTHIMAIKEQEQPNVFSSRHYAASKRGALDLKNELTKLTQDSKYLWS